MSEFPSPAAEALRRVHRDPKHRPNQRAIRSTWYGTRKVLRNAHADAVADGTRPELVRLLDPEAKWRWHATVKLQNAAGVEWL